MVRETIIGDPRKCSFELVRASEPDLLQNDSTRVLMHQTLGVIAQYEKAMIVAKLRAARQRVKAKTGRCEGRKPHKTTEAEIAVIARMHQTRENGVS